VRIARVAGLIGVVAWLAYGAYYVFSPLPPHSLAGDLGYSVVGIGRIGALATSWGNVADMLGWETWNDFPSFLYAPGGQYVLAVPMNALFADPIRTVKFEQILTLTLAFCGALRLYAAIFGRGAFAWFAGFLYAAMPLSSTLVQWDGDFAWVVALAPWAPLAALTLGRRFGAFALPAAGAICGIVTFAFSPEQGLTVGFPLLILTLTLLRRERIGLPPVGIAGAFAAWLCIPAFVVLPTRYGSHPMWWTPGTLAEFGADISSLRALYAQGPLELIGGVYREQLISANPQFNESNSLWYAVAGGAAAISLGLYAFLSGGIRSSLRRWWPVVLLAALFTLLACGTRFPLLGPWLWSGVLLHVPLLNALRTPDRFDQIGALLIGLSAAYGLQCAFRKRGAARRLALAATAIALAGYSAFFVREGMVGFGDLAQLPDYAAVNANVARIGGRTAVYAFPLNGSPLDFAAYAPVSSTAQFTWSLMQRHVDEDGGMALLRRAAIRSVVTTPNWTQPSIDGMPGDMATPVLRSPFARAEYAGPSGARVFSVDGARPMAVAVVPVCAIAGPSGFELAAGEQLLDGAALVHGLRPGCARTVSVDHDPLDDAIPASAVATWVGAELFGDLGFPASNKFEIDRMQLAQPWYRDAYSGDSLLAGNPLITVASGASNKVPFTIARPGRYSAYVRASGPAAFEARLTSGKSARGTSQFARGFHWVELSLGELPAGPQELELSILRFVTLAQQVVIDEVVVAPSGVPPGTLPTDAAIVTGREFAPPGGIDVRPPQFLFPRLAGASWSADVANVAPDPNLQIGMFGGVPQIRTTQTTGRIRFTWEGESGDYVASTVAQLAGGGSREYVASQGSGFVSRYDTNLSPKLDGGFLRLRKGAPIDVTLTRSSAGFNALMQLAVLPLRSGMEPPTEYDERGEMWNYDANYSLAALVAMRADRIAEYGGMFHAPAGTSATIRFAPHLSGGLVTVDLQFAGSGGRATLRCGGAVDAVDVGAGTVNPASVDLSVGRPSDVPCSLRIDWLSADFQLRYAHIRATGSTLLGWRASQYFAAGSYRWMCDGRCGVVLDVDGRPWNAGGLRALSGGMHRLTIERAPAPLPPLRFYRSGAWPLPAPGDASIAQQSSSAWTARTSGAQTLEIAELNDGNWFARTGGTVKAGYECDLVNTCFDVSGAQDVAIGRTLPQPLALGFAITLADVGLSGLVLLAGRRQVRPSRKG